ncbi:RHS repeat protein [Geothrix oryzisoli]|uniref:RHS repeat protein n=1 Tax=Geothrix oryzisoli TaxID=2922721 RepID=UPI001FAC9E85
MTHMALAGVLEDDAVVWAPGGLMLSRGVDVFTYDPLQRLSTAHVLNPQTGAFVDQSFAYDRYGNRAFTSTNAAAGTLATDSEALSWSASYVSGNDLPSSVNTDGGSLPTGVIYDDLGRMSQIWTTPGQSATQTNWNYDPSGRIVQENGTTYLLDSQGLRFRRKKTDGSIQYTVYGFNREPLSIFSGSTWARSMVYGFGQLVSESLPTGNIYIQSDQVGSPNLTTDSSGVLVNRTKNLPYGERLLNASPDAPKSMRRYTNHEDDPDSNAIYMQAREYLAAYGKFAQVDPAYDQTKDDPESWNLYNYVTNNPVTKTDPDGRRYADSVADESFAKTQALMYDFFANSGGVGAWHAEHDFEPAQIAETAQNPQPAATTPTIAGAQGNNSTQLEAKAPEPTTTGNAQTNASTSGVLVSRSVTTTLSIVDGGSGDYNASYTLTQSTTSTYWVPSSNEMVEHTVDTVLAHGDIRTVPDNSGNGSPTLNGTYTWVNHAHNGGFPTVQVRGADGSGALATTGLNPNTGTFRQTGINIHPPNPNSSRVWQEPGASLSSASARERPFSMGCWQPRPDANGRALIDGMRNARGSREIYLNTSWNEGRTFD